MPNPIRTARTLVLAKTEAAYRTDPNPTAAQDVMQAGDVTLTPLVGDPVDRDFYRGGFGANAALITGGSATLSFSVELAGRGDGTVPQDPAFAPLLKACGMQEVVAVGAVAAGGNPGTPRSARYNARSNLNESVTLYVAFERAVHKIIGARGTFTISIARDSVPSMNFTFTGIYVAPSDSAFETPSRAAFGDPVPYTSANDNITLSGNPISIYSAEIDYGNEVVYRNLIGANADDVIITNRTVAVTFTRELPAGGASTQDIIAGTIRPLVITHGTQAGNQVVMSMPRLQVVDSPTIGDTDGVRTEELSARALPADPGAGTDAVDGDFYIEFVGAVPV